MKTLLITYGDHLHEWKNRFVIRYTIAMLNNQCWVAGKSVSYSENFTTAIALFNPSPEANSSLSFILTMILKNVQNVDPRPGG